MDQRLFPLSTLTLKIEPVLDESGTKKSKQHTSSSDMSSASAYLTHDGEQRVKILTVSTLVDKFRIHW